MAEIRTMYAQRNFNVALTALIISLMSLFAGTTTLLWVTGIIGR